MLESLEGGIGAEYGYGAVFSGYVAGLGRGHKGDGLGSYFLIGLTHRNMGISRMDQISMDFV